MYCLSEQQIDFILDDIRARGVEMESLQLNLLDHVCCILEQKLESDGDFEALYRTTIKTFYKNELREIEEETISLLTFKNYYKMKKIMIYSGAASAFLLSSGILFKYFHLKGASIQLLLGIVCFSLVFLPLVFTLKAKEQQTLRDKFVTGLGALSAMLLSMGILFKLFHWPGANVMGLAAVALMALVFLPVYFFSGIRTAETKINTIVSSVIIVACCGLFLALVRFPFGTRLQNIADTQSYLKTEQMLMTEQRQLERDLQHAPPPTASVTLGNKINNLCADLKSAIIKAETGLPSLGADFESRHAYISDNLAENCFPGNTEADAKYNELKDAVNQYNTQLAQAKNANLQTIMVKSTVLESTNKKLLLALIDFTAIQMAVLQNEREMGHL